MHTYAHVHMNGCMYTDAHIFDYWKIQEGNRPNNPDVSFYWHSPLKGIRIPWKNGGFQVWEGVRPWCNLLCQKIRKCSKNDETTTHSPGGSLKGFFQPKLGQFEHQNNRVNKTVIHECMNTWVLNNQYGERARFGKLILQLTH